MIRLPLDTADLRSVWVCESGDRWIWALRRFLPPLMPSPLIASIESIPSQAVANSTTASPMIPAGHPKAVLWWEIRSGELVSTIDRITHLTATRPGVLQIACASRSDGATPLGPRRRSALSQIGVAMTIDHIEQIPSLRPLIAGYFAPTAEHLE